MHERIVDDFLTQLRTAWDAGDADAYAALFSNDATYVTWRGDPLVGREEIRRVHGEVFHKYGPRTLMEVKPFLIGKLSSDVISVLTVGGTAVSRPVSFDKFQTLTLVQLGDAWLCAAFQNGAMSDSARLRYS